MKDVMIYTRDNCYACRLPWSLAANEELRKFGKFDREAKAWIVPAEEAHRLSDVLYNFFGYDKALPNLDVPPPPTQSGYTRSIKPKVVPQGATVGGAIGGAIASGTPSVDPEALRRYKLNQIAAAFGTPITPPQSIDGVNIRDLKLLTDAIAAVLRGHDVLDDDLRQYLIMKLSEVDHGSI